MNSLRRAALPALLCFLCLLCLVLSACQGVELRPKGEVVTGVSTGSR